MTRRLLTALLLAGLAAATPAARQSAPQAPEPAPPTFRVEVNYVEVDALVTDAQGNAVTGLSRDDFEVLEDGRPQAVTAFSPVNIPIDRAERPLFAAAPIEPDVQSNQRADGRLYLIVLDDLHTSFTNTPRVKAALRQFLERNFGTNDLAAVVFTSGRASDGQDFTNNARLLRQAVDRFSGRNLPSATVERLGAGVGLCGSARAMSAMQEGNRQASPILDPCEAERGFNARNAMTSIRRLADFMGGVHGRRKAMLLVSEGISYDINDVFNNRNATIVLDETRDAIAAATRGNVSIYAIDPRGLAGFEDAASTAVDSIANPNDSLVGGLQSELMMAQSSLRTLAGETGGFAVVNRNDFADAFARIVRENSSYYLLGYYPSNDRRDGRFRKIEVRVKRPGLQVRSRRGYVAPRGRAPQPPRPGGNSAATAASEALASPIPIANVPVAVFAAPFKGTAPNAAVAIAVEFRIDGFQLTEANGVTNGLAEVTFLATDRQGKTYPGNRHALTIALKPDTFARARDHGFRLVSQIDLPPGRYQLRVAAGEQGGRAGSVLYDLEVPDFYKAPLAMSGLAVTSPGAMQAPTAAPRNPLADFLPAPLVTTREFERRDELSLFAEFYENTPGAAVHGFDITTSILDETGRVTATTVDQRSSSELQGKAGGYGYTARVPLQNLTPGTYVIRVEGKSRISGREQAVSRDMQIRVR